MADKAQGNLFEQLEVLKFNQEALRKDSALVAKTTASQGAPHDSVDIIIKRPFHAAEIQAKSCNSAAQAVLHYPTVNMQKWPD